MIRSGVIGVAVAALLVACGGPPEEPIGRVVALRTAAFNGNCRGVGAQAILHGAAEDPAVAWLTDLGGGPRRAVIWPAGDAAIFDPALRIVDSNGRTVIREGDFVDGGCVTGPDATGALLVPNPKDAFRLDCGPVALDVCPMLVNAIRFASPDWPRERVESLTFTEVGGRYVIVLENGGRVQGDAPSLL